MQPVLFICNRNNVWNCLRRNGDARLVSSWMNDGRNFLEQGIFSWSVIFTPKVSGLSFQLRLWFSCVLIFKIYSVFWFVACKYCSPKIAIKKIHHKKLKDKDNWIKLFRNFLVIGFLFVADESLCLPTLPLLFCSSKAERKTVVIILLDGNILHLFGRW